MMTQYQPSPENVDSLGAINDLLGNASPIANSFRSRPAYLGVLPGGQLYFDSNLELDTDGWSGGAGRGDPDYQSETSLRYEDTSSLDSNRVPYFVLPKPREWAGQFGIALGDYAALLYRGRVAFAVFGDRGPTHGLGEGSIELLRRLGKERIRENGTVINAGMGPGIVTIVFPGSGPGRPPRNEAELLSEIDRIGQARFDELSRGGIPPQALAAGPVRSLAAQIVDKAEHEFALYGTCLEQDPPLRQRIGEYWEALGIRGIDGADHESYWSAAFISFVVREAGAGASFSYDQLHAKYVHKAIVDRKSGTAAVFWGYRTNAIPIAPGDILAMNRGNSAPIDYEEAEENDDFGSHCDIVVKIDHTDIHTIGGNVGRAPGTVGQKIFRWDNGVLRNAANPRQEVYAVLRPPAIT